MEKVNSQKGKSLILLEGYQYREARINIDNSVSWRCVLTTCKGRIRVLEEEWNVVTDHNHAPNPSKSVAIKCVTEIKERAKSTMENPRQIIQATTSGITLEAAALLPEYLSSQRTIERVRQKENLPYPQPSTIAEIRIPDDLQTTIRGENFILWDSGVDDPNRIFMFGTIGNLQLLSEYQHWSVDGTFKIAPELFYQVFTIHGLIGRNYMPFVYVLLPNKTEQSYTRIFEQIRVLKPGIGPSSVMCDFEKAIQNAATNVFENVHIQGCLFHLGQCLWSKILEFQLVDVYRNQEDIRICIKMLLALSFVPEVDVITAFEEIVENAPQVIDELINYWEDTYIGRMRRNRRAEPRFPVAVWNVQRRVEAGLPRTNNSVEGWHRAFQQTINCQHPSVYKLVDQMRKEQDHTEIQMERFAAGFRQPEASKCKYYQLNRRLERLVNGYDPTQKLNFLRGISNNLQM